MLYETLGGCFQWSVSDRSEADISENGARNPLIHKIVVALSNQPPAVCNYVLESEYVVIFYFYPCWYNSSWFLRKFGPQYYWEFLYEALTFSQSWSYFVRLYWIVEEQVNIVTGSFRYFLPCSHLIHLKPCSELWQNVLVKNHPSEFPVLSFGAGCFEYFSSYPHRYVLGRSRCVVPSLHPGWALTSIDLVFQVLICFAERFLSPMPLKEVSLTAQDK